MTNISGKIYQMKNAANNENRFPRTVMEAVLGLSSYLQTQFSNLADIYMPIEGITETKNGQEFVFRKSPQTIKSKALTIDRIDGKTLAWNQLCSKEQSIASWSTPTQTTIAKSGDEFVCTAGSSGSIMRFKEPQGITGVLNTSHKYYCRATLKTSVSCNLRITLGNTGIASIPNAEPGKYYTLSGIGTNFSAPTEGHKSFIFGGDGTFAQGDIVTVKDDLVLHDLTLLYGSAIDGMTDAQILEKFESEYPGYHDYNIGQLVSNAASGIQTIGFNQWDEDWEQGYYGADGQKVASSNRIRSVNPIRVIPGVTYFINLSGQGRLGGIRYYDSNMNYIGAATLINSDNGYAFTPAQNVSYFHAYAGDGYGGSYNHDICINISNAEKNGTYEPYKESTLPLNLDDFWVKNAQGTRVRIQGGLKSAGAVRDEIVGNKYIQRVGVMKAKDGNWQLYTSGDLSVFYLTDSTIKPFSAQTARGNVICSVYETLPNSSVLSAESTETGICVWNNGSRFYLKDTTKANAEALIQYFTTTNAEIYYELATPIEYILETPLVLTMTAGDTERRLPEDSILAPFCCDMTYGTNPSEMANSAGYATLAGALYNARKIWGQDFDGTADVSGGLTGVTSINTAIYLGSGGNVGIGQPIPAYKLDVNGDTRVAGNLSVGTSSGSTINLTRGSYNYIWANQTGGAIALGVQDRGGIGSANMTLHINQYGIGINSGSSSAIIADSSKALNLYGNAYINGDVTLVTGKKLKLSNSGTVTAELYCYSAETETIFDSNMPFHFTCGVYSDSFVSAGGVASSSDKLLKNNISDVADEKAVSVLSALQPREWIWNEKSALSGQKGAGLVAQEVNDILPFSVVEGNGKYLSLNYNVLHAYEIKGWQNHEERLKKLEEKLLNM